MGKCSVQQLQRLRQLALQYPNTRVGAKLAHNVQELEARLQAVEASEQTTNEIVEPLAALLSYCTINRETEVFKLLSTGSPSSPAPTQKPHNSKGSN
eukprot:m.91065 g.91065  ORF g.91065 m.91065 type:complete len:97 (-) comp12937_c0_seq3:2942-3232(-)